MQLATTNQPLLWLKQHLSWVAYGLSASVSILAIVAWGTMQQWQLNSLSTYELFPLFGIWAFSLLWSQYLILAAGFLLQADDPRLGRFYKISGTLVLIGILLHPSLLIFQLWQDGYGLPPGSFLEHYVPPGYEGVALLGPLSLLVFLSYELHRWFRKKRWWPAVLFACDAALVAVYFHGLLLGGELQQGWYRLIWLLYGLVLIPVLIATFFRRRAAIRK